MGGRRHCGCLGTSFQAQRWLSLDTCGLLGVSLSWSVHLFALVVIAWKLIGGSLLATALYLLAYVPTAILAMASLFQAWTTDPGAVPLGARPLVTLKRATSSTVSNASSTKDEKDDAGPASGSVVPLEKSTSAGTESTQAPPPPRQRGLRRCHKCQDNFKPARAHHDSVTGRCIVKFDHYCPWVGNAVGAKNHKFFCLFLLYTAGTCLLSLLFLLLRAIRCGFVRELDSADNNNNVHLQAEEAAAAALDAADKPYHHQRLLLRPGEQEFVYPGCDDFYGNHFIIALLVCSVTFLIFSCTMGCEQLEAIETGKSKIARMKQRVGQAGTTEFSTVTDEFNELFGGDSPHAAWHWFLPLAVWFPRGMEKVVLGYDWDEAFEAVPYRQDETNHNGAAAVSDEQVLAMEHGEAAPLSSSSSLTLNQSSSLRPDVTQDGEADGLMMTNVIPSSSRIKTSRRGGTAVKYRRSNSRDDPLRAAVAPSSNHQNGFGNGGATVDESPHVADSRLT